MSLVVVGLICGGARAAVIQFETNFEYSEATAPAGTPPWLTATFDDGGASGSVDLTLEATNLTDDEFVSQWNFNLNPNLDPDDLSFAGPTKTGSFADPTIGTGVDAFKAGPDHDYDIEFDFSQSGQGSGAQRFGVGESAEYTITGITSLTANDFDFVSGPGGGKGPFPTGAHVQGIGPNDNDSGWVTVPEPTSLAMLGLGGVWMIGPWRRRRGSQA